MTEAIICTIESVRTRASTSEALLTLAVPLEQAALIAGFMGKIQQQVGVAFADVGGNKQREPEQQKNYGHYISALYRSGFFLNPHVLAALGTDDEYREWVQCQKSAISGDFSEYVNGEGRCIAAHVRRAGESGTAHKAEYACIPLTDAEHQRQHARGESELGGKEAVDRLRARYVSDWAHGRLREWLAVESLAEVEPSKMVDWARLNGLMNYLPAVYK